MQHPSRVDMRDRDKHTVHGAGLLPVFATRARSVEKTLVHASVLFKTIFFFSTLCASLCAGLYAGKTPTTAWCTKRGKENERH